jgi:hypothetical protein
VGAGIGTGIGVAFFAQGDTSGWVMPIFGVLAAGLGAAVGAVFGGGRKRVLIYEDN